MMTRREALCLLSSASVGALLATRASANDAKTPKLAHGSPTSPERKALIEAFKKQSDGLEKRFEARTHKSDWVMPYRLFKPEASGKAPLVMYLHGSGGLGDDNLKQLGLGNIFGTRVWALPEHQKRFPCYVVAPQTDRGWIKYDFSQETDAPAKALAGLGDGARLALEVIDELRREFKIDERRIYVTGQSMGGAGVWNMLAYRPKFFAAAVVCCGGVSMEDGTGGIETPLWAFQGDSDQTVPPSLSRERIAARRKAGGHPLYTEYAGVDHNVWEWAYTEPELLKWVFAERRAS
ncbi:MAG: prolyl oligopeptidase family serine peptidase [Acidobacteria bacterium]|nr:prolyl oligopeptidase family serine peptidase [Acidobacteriota bacterium]